jgi:hypothetical protein
MLAIPLAVGCGDSDKPEEDERIEGTEAGDCSDGSDNDLDGLFDCEEAECAGSPDCEESDVDADDGGSDDGTADDTGTPVVDGDSDDDGGADDGGFDDDGGSDDDGAADDGAADADADAVTDVECTAVVTDWEPWDGESDWYYREPLSVEFNFAPETSVSITLAEEGGSDVPIELTWHEDHGQSVPITGDLTANTDYTLRVECAGEWVSSFRTSEYGSPLTVPTSSVEGRVYALDLPAATFIEPSAVGALLGPYLDFPLLLEVGEMSSSSLELNISDGIWDDEGGPSHPDTPIYDLGESDFDSAPFFAMDSPHTTLPFALWGVGPGSYYDVHVEGTFNTDATAIGGLRLSGLLDTSEAGPLLELGDDVDAVCDYFSMLGGSCVDCGDGEEVCLNLSIIFNDAEYIPGLTLDD